MKIPSLCSEVCSIRVLQSTPGPAYIEHLRANKCVRVNQALVVTEAMLDRW